MVYIFNNRLSLDLLIYEYNHILPINHIHYGFRLVIIDSGPIIYHIFILK